MSDKKIKNVLDSLIKKEHAAFNKKWSDKYPNLQAILMGTVSHPINNWFGVRPELSKFVKEFDAAIKRIAVLEGRALPVEDGEECGKCGRPHFE